MMQKGLTSRPPARKPAVIGMVVVALIFGVSFIMPAQLGQSTEALAAEIAQNDPQVRELLPNGTLVDVVRSIRPGEENLFHVLFLIPGESIWEEGNETKAVMIDTAV